MELKMKITSTTVRVPSCLSHIYIPSLAFTKFVSIGNWPAQFFVVVAAFLEVGKLFRKLQASETSSKSRTIILREASLRLVVCVKHLTTFSFFGCVTKNLKLLQKAFLKKQPSFNVSVCLLYDSSDALLSGIGERFFTAIVVIYLVLSSKNVT